MIRVTFVNFCWSFYSHIFVAASHQTRLDTRSKARRPIKVGIKGRGRSGRSRDSNPACLCCSSAHLVQCEPDEASSFTNPNVGPGTYAGLRLKLDAWSSAVQRGQKSSSPTRRLPSRSWGPIRPRVCSWFRAPIRHECQTAQLKSRGRSHVCDRIGSEKLRGRGIYDWLKKRIFLIVNLFLHFSQRDTRRLSAQRSILFILL